MNDQPPAEQNDVQLNAVVPPRRRSGDADACFYGVHTGVQLPTAQHKPCVFSVTESYLRSHSLQLDNVSVAFAAFCQAKCTISSYGALPRAV